MKRLSRSHRMHIVLLCALVSTVFWVSLSTRPKEELPRAQTDAAEHQALLPRVEKPLAPSDESLSLEPLFELGGATGAVAIYQDYGYVHRADHIEILDIGDPGSIEAVGHVDVPVGEASEGWRDASRPTDFLQTVIAMQVVDRRLLVLLGPEQRYADAYTALDGDEGEDVYATSQLITFDLDVPTRPQQIGLIEFRGIATAMAANPDACFVAIFDALVVEDFGTSSAAARMLTVDLAPHLPELRSSTKVEDIITRLRIDQDFVLGLGTNLDAEKTLYLFEASGEAALEPLSTLDLSWVATFTPGLVFTGKEAMVIDHSGLAYRVDYRDPRSPVLAEPLELTERFDDRNRPADWITDAFDHDGRLILVDAMFGKLASIDLATEEGPRVIGWVGFPSARQNGGGDENPPEGWARSGDRLLLSGGNMGDLSLIELEPEPRLLASLWDVGNIRRVLADHRSRVHTLEDGWWEVWDASRLPEFEGLASSAMEESRQSSRVSPTNDMIVIGNRLYEAESHATGWTELASDSQPRTGRLEGAERGFRGLARSGNRVLEAISDVGITIHGVDEEGHAELLGHHRESESGASAAIRGDRAFLASDHLGVNILDIQDPAAVRHLGRLVVDQPVAQVLLTDSALVAISTDFENDAFVTRLRLADPDSDRPEVLSELELPHRFAWQKVVRGDRIFMQRSDGRFVVLDVSNPVAPRIALERPWTFSAFEVTPDGATLFGVQPVGGRLEVWSIGD